jgi:hypothetical protein
MATDKDIRDECDYHTEKISAAVWIVNLGVLGIAWTMLNSSSPRIPALSPTEVLSIFIFCVLGMASHLSQHWVAYQYAKSILRRMEKEGLEEFQYDKKASLYRWRERLFKLKIIFTLIATGLLMVGIVSRLLAL